MDGSILNLYKFELLDEMKIYIVSVSKHHILTSEEKSRWVLLCHVYQK